MIQTTPLPRERLWECEAPAERIFPVRIGSAGASHSPNVCSANVCSAVAMNKEW